MAINDQGGAGPHCVTVAPPAHHSFYGLPQMRNHEIDRVSGGNGIVSPGHGMYQISGGPFSTLRPRIITVVTHRTIAVMNTMRYRSKGIFCLCFCVVLAKGDCLTPIGGGSLVCNYSVFFISVCGGAACVSH